VDSDPQAVPVEDGVPAASAVTRVFERRIVFLTRETDSTLVVPWFFTARDGPDGVAREARGWLARNGTWEAFYQETWRGPPTRSPWRPLPRSGLRLVVGIGDALEEIVFQRGARQLEIRFGSLLSEWNSPEGSIYRVHEADVVLSSQRVGGLLLDMSRTRPPGGFSGDWAFLVSGDSLEMVVDASRASEQPDSTASVWARVDFRQLRWNDAVMAWEETRAFERSRREVPVAWRIRSADGSLEGTLSAETTEVEAGPGSGARLPVYALFEVSGTLVVEGAPFPVEGVLRHVQP
jgi:hypothetical protein